MYHIGIALCLGALSGILVGTLVRHGLRTKPASTRDQAPIPADAPQGDAMPVDMSHPAVRYARAFMDADYDYIIEHTDWMQKRLRRAQLETGHGEYAAEAREALRRSLSEHTIAGNQLRLEGVEDQYVFVRGAELAVQSIDAGRKDLSGSVTHRVWLRVTYPVRIHALRDRQSLPIRSLTVGVNISAEGYIIKAGIFGNLEIDEGSITYWDPEPGG